VISVAALVATALVCVLVGVGLGALVMKLWFQARVPRDLEARFNTLQSEYQQYQQNVAQHFLDSARLITETEQRQKALREQLVSGALLLTSADVSRAILADTDEPALLEGASQYPMDANRLAPAKDWAPKTPGQAGVLSEDFGLREEGEEDVTPIEVRTARH
jgi:uncharacterized protein